MADIRSRPARRSAALLVLAAIPLLLALAAYLRSSANVYPYGDEAVAEIYTLHAVRGFWPFGPYSQFTWHHPGPLMFYLIAPLYALGGEQTVGMHAGALAISLVSALTIAVILIRSATPTIACTGIVALGLFAYRVDYLVASYWNPHLVVLPAAALLVLCARLASGRSRTLPAIALAGSFLAQTHVGLVPFVLALVGSALLAAAVFGDRRLLARPIATAAGVLLLLWLPPLVDEVRHWPGNLSQLARFFLAPFEGQPWAIVLDVWGDMMTAAFRPGLPVPAGGPAEVMAGYWLPTLAVVQAVLLAAGFVSAVRRRKFFDAAFCALGLAASLIGCWSITRIRMVVSEYMVFWMSTIGALNWAAIVGLALDAFMRLDDRVRATTLRRVAWAMTAVVVAIVAWSGARVIAQAKQRAAESPHGPNRDVRILSEELEAYLAREHIRRPLFTIRGDTWAEAAGVILNRYRRSEPFAVAGELVWMFGAPLGPIGQEDAIIVVTDRAGHHALGEDPGNHCIAWRSDVYLYATSLGRSH